MRRPSRAVITAFVLATVAASGGFSGCGGGGGGGNAEESIRNTVIEVLTAAAKNDRARAVPLLSPNNFPKMSFGKPWNSLTPAQQTDVTNALWNTTKTVSKETTLDDDASIRAAVTAGRTVAQPTVRKASVYFSGPADGKIGSFKFRADLTYGGDSVWRVIDVELDL